MAVYDGWWPKAVYRSPLCYNCNAYQYRGAAVDCRNGTFRWHMRAFSSDFPGRAFYRNGGTFVR
jgi:hypothetical protein